MEAQARYEVMQSPKLDLADVKKYIAPGANDKELFLFMNIARSYGLNPFKREVHFIKYGQNPASVVVGYEIYLKRAESSGQLDGWSVTILDQGTPKERAQITIHRKDRKNPFIWEVSRKEFDKGQSTWKLMPEFMLKKVAIAQGFRLCFPEQLGGMPYIPEEINGKGSEELPIHPVEQEAVIPPNQTKEKNLFEQIMSARSTFCSLIMSNKDKMLDFLPDELLAVKARWQKASAQGVGGVTKGAPWPLEDKPENQPPPPPQVVDFGEEDKPVDDTAGFVGRAETYLAELSAEGKEGVLKLYGIRTDDHAEIREALRNMAPGYREAFLQRASKQLDLQNAKEK